MKLLIITITACLAFFIWGSITVVRLVPDRNYHEPTAQEKLTECINRTNGSTESLVATCSKIAGVK